MSNEYNVNDMLTMLKSSVNSQQENPPQNTDIDVSGDMSEDALKAQLKNKFFDNEIIPSTEEESAIGEYTIDHDFLSDIENMRDQEQEVKAHKDELPEASMEEAQELDEPPFDVDVKKSVDDAPFDVDAEDSEDEATFEPEVIADAESKETGDDTFVFEDFILVPNEEPAYSEDSENISESDVEEKIDAFAENVQIVAAEEDSVFIENVFDETEDEDGDFDDDEDADDQVILADDLFESAEKVADEAPVELSESIDELLSVEEIDEFEEFDESTPADETVDVAETNEQEDVQEEAQEEPHETFIASMRKIGFDFSNERTEIKDTSEQSPVEDAESEELGDDLRDEDLDYSTINLMMQFCDKDELDKTIGDEKIESYLRQEQSEIADEQISSAGFEGEEYSNNKQNERIYENYKHARFVALAKLCGCAFLAVIATVFEMIPLLGVNADGLFDYTQYPAVYVLFGLQFVAFAAAICYKQLWQGLKRAFSSTPNKDSIVAVILVLTFVYDVIISIILAVTGDDLPAIFNAVAVITVAISAAADYIRITAEMRAFSVYSSDAQKFTMIKESKQGRVSSKMYVGGLPMEKDVYTIKAIDFPRGFFKCVGKGRSADKIITTALIPVLVISLIATILTIVLGAGAYDACSVFLLTVYAVLPIAYIYSGNFPNAFAALKLAKRGSAVAGEKMIEKYNGCDVIVFEDLHMFRKCKTEEVGIAMYDTRFAYLTLGCIDALYSKIGGPLSGMQMQLPDVFKFTDVSIRRITRNGVEAVIDKKHVIIAGDIEFMKRYGLAFPEDEKKSDRSSLCVSINGAVSAKLSVRYETEPVFEMIVERLYSEGILCAIETYDPLINSAMLQRARTLGSSPISVIHMNAEDFVKKEVSDFREELDGIVSCASKLKLAEAEVWVKRQSKINKILKTVAIAFSAGGALLVTLFVAGGVVGAINQFHILMYLLAQITAATVIMLLKFPRKNYFTTDALYFEYEKQHEKELKKQQDKDN
ncbi:MAG: hypothetical protein E7653_00500 [Ruminococcaceae bacterium]|nr:hypothetical protein [Oscillospiraceae bacterium]